MPDPPQGRDEVLLRSEIQMAVGRTSMHMVGGRVHCGAAGDGCAVVLLLMVSGQSARWLQRSLEPR